MRKRIALVVALFHEAGKCLIDIPLLLIQPLWTFLVLFIFLVYWVLILAYVATLGMWNAVTLQRLVCEMVSCYNAWCVKRCHLATLSMQSAVTLQHLACETLLVLFVLINILLNITQFFTINYCSKVRLVDGFISVCIWPCLSVSLSVCV